MYLDNVSFRQQAHIRITIYDKFHESWRKIPTQVPTHPYFDSSSADSTIEVTRVLHKRKTNIQTVHKLLERILHEHFQVKTRNQIWDKKKFLVVFDSEFKGFWFKNFLRNSLFCINMKSCRCCHRSLYVYEYLHKYMYI